MSWDGWAFHFHYHGDHFLPPLIKAEDRLCSTASPLYLYKIRSCGCGSHQTCRLIKISSVWTIVGLFLVIENTNLMDTFELQVLLWKYIVLCWRVKIRCCSPFYLTEVFLILPFKNLNLELMSAQARSLPSVSSCEATEVTVSHCSRGYCYLHQHHPTQ